MIFYGCFTTYIAKFNYQDNDIILFLDGNIYQLKQEGERIPNNEHNKQAKFQNFPEPKNKKFHKTKDARNK